MFGMHKYFCQISGEADSKILFFLRNFWDKLFRTSHGIFALPADLKTSNKSIRGWWVFLCAVNFISKKYSKIRSLFIIQKSNRTVLSFFFFLAPSCLAFWCTWLITWVLPFAQTGDEQKRAAVRGYRLPFRGWPSRPCGTKRLCLRRICRATLTWVE